MSAASSSEDVSFALGDRSEQADVSERPVSEQHDRSFSLSEQHDSMSEQHNKTDDHQSEQNAGDDDSGHEGPDGDLQTERLEGSLVVRSESKTSTDGAQNQSPSLSPAMRRQLDLLADCCRQAERQYEKISFELKVPSLDDTLYRKYLFPSKGPNINENPAAVQRRLVKLLKLLDVLTEHKEETLHVLEHIAKREECLADLRRFNSQTIQSLEIQASALQLLYALQKHTLAVVEAIVQWRQKLSIPFPFMKGESNYLLSIAETMKKIENSQIGKVLPLQFAAFPLLSNVPSMKLFEEDSSYLTYPLRSQKPGVKSAENPLFRKRLVAAEAVIHAEVEQQLNNCHFLLRRCEAGYFIPIVDLEQCDVYPPMRSRVASGPTGKKMGGGGRRDAAGGGGWLVQYKGLFGIKIRSSRHQQELTDALISTVSRLGEGPDLYRDEGDDEEEEEEEEGEQHQGADEDAPADQQQEAGAATA